MNNIDLKNIQNIENCILKEIDTICIKNNIKYSLFGGNLIGAIRHGGFIPWDDDMDIIMTRDNYDHFIKIIESELPEDLIIEKEGLNSKFNINHTKIIKKNTIMCSFEEYKERTHNHGIWVDIFILDKVPKNKNKRKKYLFIAKMRILFTRNCIYKRGSLFQYLISIICLKLPNKIRTKIKNSCEKYILKYKNLTSNFDYCCLASPDSLNCFYDKNIMDSYHYCDYDNFSFMISDEYDIILKQNFGDYMKLPPESERICKHKPDICIY